MAQQKFNIKNKLIVLLTGLLFNLYGCSSKNIIEAPNLACSDIVIDYGEELIIDNYCDYDESTNISIDEYDTNKEGVTNLNVIAGKDGAFSIQTINLTVNKEVIPDCGDNSTYNKETKKCDCNEGYEESEAGCVIIPEEEEVIEEIQPVEEEPIKEEDEEVKEEVNENIFYASTYGSIDKAFDACVAKCQSLSGNCSCKTTTDQTQAVLSR